MPAAAVIPAARVVATIIGLKASVATVKSLGKSAGSTDGRLRDTGSLGTGRGERYSGGRSEIL